MIFSIVMVPVQGWAQAARNMQPIVLAIGVNDAPSGLNNLKYADDNAVIVASLFAGQNDPNLFLHTIFFAWLVGRNN